MASATGLHSLATIIKRLEAATSRLEDLSVSQENFLAPVASSKIVNPPATAYTPVTPQAPAQSSGGHPAIVPAAASETPKSVSAFDELIITGKVKPFLELSKSFAGASVVEVATLVEKEYHTLRAFLLVAGSCQKPDQKTVDGLLSPLQASIEAISRAKEANRRDRDWFNHLTLIGEGAPSVGWVVSPKPGPYVGDIKDSVDYYGNKVIKEYKEKNPKHVEWVRSFTGILDEMRKYVTEYHTTGLSWNPKGVTVEQFQQSQGSSGPPPPPPPPPPPSATLPGPTPGGAAAVFAELNRGDEVTKGLRKVDKSEMTHKNPALRAGSVVPATPASPSAVRKPIKPSKPHALSGKKPAKFLLDGNKWLIEYQENESALTVENAEISQSVNIFGCKNTTVIIKGKINAVTIVNSTKTSVLVESVVSSISVTSSHSFALQVTGSAPMIQLDSTDSGQIYLSKASLGVELTTAKCSSINVSLPVEGEEEGIFEEHAMPEMLKTIVKDGKLVTTIVEHVG